MGGAVIRWYLRSFVEASGVDGNGFNLPLPILINKFISTYCLEAQLSSYFVANP